MIKKINDVNHITKLDSGITLSQALTDRESLINKLKTLSDILENATNQMAFRMTHTELKVYTTVSIDELQKQKDVLSKKIRMTDAEIQSKNWTVDL